MAARNDPPIQFQLIGESDMNALAIAMNVIFADANMAVAALWFAGGTGPGIAVRVIRKSPDEITPLGRRACCPKPPCWTPAWPTCQRLLEAI